MQSSVHHSTPSAVTTLHVGNTKPLQPSLTPDLPLACTTLLLTTLNLAAPQTIERAILSIAAFIAALANVLLLARRPSTLSRNATLILLGLATITLVASRAVALGGRATRTLVSVYEIPPRVVQTPPRQPLVSALEALERSQKAGPNVADMETEETERDLDETREDHVEKQQKSKVDTANKELGLSGSFRETHFRGSNETYIVTSHAGESCSSACARYNYVCAPKHFRKVNFCGLLLLRMSCKTCFEKERFDPMALSLPGAIKQSPEPGVQKDQRNSTICFTVKDLDHETAQCHVSTQRVKRLCPCVM